VGAGPTPPSTQSFQHSSCRRLPHTGRLYPPSPHKSCIMAYCSFSHLATWLVRTALTDAVLLQCTTTTVRMIHASLTLLALACRSPSHSHSHPSRRCVHVALNHSSFASPSPAYLSVPSIGALSIPSWHKASRYRTLLTTSSPLISCPFIRSNTMMQHVTTQQVAQLPQR